MCRCLCSADVLLAHLLFRVMEAAIFSHRWPQLKASSCYLDMDLLQKLRELHLTNKIAFQCNSAGYNPHWLEKKYNNRCLLTIQNLFVDIKDLESGEGTILTKNMRT
ncbi:hypothetical protein CIPAW_04G149400 [Carya illinoinensis]|uniref:Uncharacterized protein n=1 Tax=Carya illinoinensis TaxID=32201 RepID=A0A8T1QV76_CARIL|nr:hypothetical protein CIPAW_04G149400 [Carya illinoinensis]